MQTAFSSPGIVRRKSHAFAGASATLLLAIIFVIAWPKAAFAHAPHDEITAIQISSGFIFDQTPTYPRS
jgi:hypothetical protein